METINENQWDRLLLQLRKNLCEKLILSDDMTDMRIDIAIAIILYFGCVLLLDTSNTTY